MKGLRHSSYPLRRCAASVLVALSFVAAGLPAIAQARFRLNLPDLRAPGNRESGATRSNTCVDPEDTLIALIPESNYGLTQRAYPTFYAYLPNNTAQLAKFVMYDGATDELIHEGQFSVKASSGIVGISLPDNGLQNPLQVGQSYVWYLTLICDPGAVDQSGNAVVTGTIERVTPSVESQQAPTEALPGIYAEAGLWYDALTASADLRQGNNAAPWNFLLDEVNLEMLIPVPVLSETPIQPEPVVSTLP